jgi:hypothetical protein
MNFHANDVGYVPAVAGHYVENTGDTDLVFLEMSKASEFVDFSLNNWIRRLPPEMCLAHEPRRGRNQEDPSRKAVTDREEIVSRFDSVLNVSIGGIQHGLCWLTRYSQQPRRGGATDSNLIWSYRPRIVDL